MLPEIVPDEPAVRVGKALVVADLHIGIEMELLRNGIRIPFQTDRLAERINRIAELEGVSELIIDGDLKHDVSTNFGVQAAEVARFLEEVRVPVRVVKGNHDGGLEALPSTGILYGSLGIFHGHAYPDPSLLDAKYWITAHVHPFFGFRDGGKIYKEPCWIVGRVNREFLKERYGKARNIKIVVLPAFSDVVGGTAVNIKGITGPLSSMIRDPSFFLLDGTEVA